MDTPGTNVIVGRQQRLTEEFVPRADLVLFVLSADRPLTESEVRGWGAPMLLMFGCCFRLLLGAGRWLAPASAAQSGGRVTGLKCFSLRSGD